MRLTLFDVFVSALRRRALNLDDKQFACAACGFSSYEPFDRCPQCGEERPRSFWSRLFGR